MSDPDEATATLATPAFLSSLRPPPLPLWAQSPASTALSSTRLSLILASTLASTGFTIARSSTQLAFHIARTVLTPILTPLGVVVDQAIGLDSSLGPGVAVASLRGALNGAETLALFGIAIGSEITRASLGKSYHAQPPGPGTATSTVAYLEGFYGNDEALRALSAFLKLVETEFGESLPSDPYEEGGLSRWNMIQIVKAAATWGALQSVTAALDGTRFAPELEELDLEKWGRKSRSKDDEVFFEVTEEQILEGGEEVIEAEVTGADVAGGDETEEERTRMQLRRFSRLCLGSYGGMGMLFFGVKLPSSSSPNPSPSSGTPLTAAALSTRARAFDQRALARAFGQRSAPPTDASIAAETDTAETDNTFELEAEMGQIEAGWTEVEQADPAASSATVKPSLWQLLSGSHDTHVLETLGDLTPGSSAVDVVDPPSIPTPFTSPTTSASKKGRRPPRFFVVTDHPNRQVLLCLRGTMTIDDVATDLACEASTFDSSDFWDSEQEGEGRRYEVHGGMFEVARAMGSREGPVTRAIARALEANSEYDLFLTGHSLGAGVAALLGIMWANPGSCRTSSKSGLPAGRKVKVYGFAPPCTTDAALSSLCKKLIHSFVFSSDAVSRFSLGHIRDIRSAAAWLCYANDNPEESCNNILSRLLAYRNGRLDGDPATKAAEEVWFTALRTTLEANMSYATLFPPGDVLWLVHENDLVLPGPPRAGPRLFRVTGRVEVVFKQMLFSSKMLSSHLPHKYMKAIEDGL